MQRTSHSYFVVMEDFGQRGLEAVVTPEITRRAVVEFIKNGNYRNIVFIHHIDGLTVEDVTEELKAEALPNWHPDWRESETTRLEWLRDHKCDLRKESV